MVSRVRWGVILVALGVLLLLNTTGLVSVSFWSYIWDLWPVILIAIGLEKIFSATSALRPLAWLSPVIIVAMVAYAVVAGERGDGRNSWHYDWNFDTGDAESEVYTWTEVSSGASRLDLMLQLTAGRVVVRGGAQPGNLLEGRVTYRGDKPRVRSQSSGGTLNVSVEDRSQGSHRGRDQWIIKLSDSLPVGLTLAGGAARMRLDLTDVKVETLTMSTAAADVTVSLGSLARSVDCHIACAAASLDVTVPPGAGVRVKRDSMLQGFSSGDLDLVERGDFMETPEFESKPVQINLYLESAVSSLRLRTNDGAGSGSVT
jgi:hypothetical protein